jgi:hypothetical protein
MKESIDRRLTRLETRAGLNPTAWVQPFRYIDDPRDPEGTARAIKDAEQYRLENPGGLIIRHIIVSPPDYGVASDNRYSRK